jgi:hypothetical protein
MFVIPAKSKPGPPASDEKATSKSPEFQNWGCPPFVNAQRMGHPGYASLKGWATRPGISSNDQAVAKELIRDLENAVAGK